DASPKMHDWARAAARRVAESCGVRPVDRATLEAWRDDGSRTLYVFDVRDPAEYEAGHLPGAISAPGGQLIQATDQYVGTLGARIVLTDNAEVRAAMTASWLRQMGFADVFVLPEAGGETGWPPIPVLETSIPPQTAIGSAALNALLLQDKATVLDLSLSRNYLARHIPGAWFAIRTRLASALRKIPVAGTLVLTSEDGALARLAVAEAQEALDRPVRCLGGGNAAWRAAGYAFSAEARMADEAIDQWRKPYERTGDVEGAMKEYLAWETDLLPRIERDGSLHFSHYGVRPQPQAGSQ
ncbi:MAG TPA: rhodanese-like domain-containing protein, partial [Xanthobacteraceae bacterium]